MKFLRDPLLHFVLLGGALFAAYVFASGVSGRDEGRRIEIDTGTIELLAGTFERQWGRPPMPEELDNLVAARVREEILYREALAVGLDNNDAVVRRRMVQKMEMLSQDLALLSDPADEELRTYFDEHREEYRVPPRLSFSHVYFNADRRGRAVEEDSRRVLAGLRAESPPPRRAPERGDATMIEPDYSLRTPGEVARVFGSSFAESLFELEPGWQGPILSGYGFHLVYVGERVEGRIPGFDEVRDRLVVEYNRERRDRASEALFEGLASRYRIVIADRQPW